MCEREEGGEGAGMITTFFHAASTTTSSHPPRNGHTNDFVGGCFIPCWRLCPEQGTGGRGPGRLQASASSRLCTQREGGGGGVGERGGEEGVLGRAGRLQASDLTPTTEPQLLGRSAAHRRDYPSIGCLECITTTSTGIGWTGGRGREAARCGRDTTLILWPCHTLRPKRRHK